MARGTMCTPPKGLQFKTFLALPNLGLVEELGKKLLKSKRVRLVRVREASAFASRDQSLRNCHHGLPLFGNNIFEAKNGKGK